MQARQQVISAMYPLKHLGDFNPTGTLNGLCNAILRDDRVNPLGRRAVLFSQYAYKLEGFSFNKRRPFEQYLKHPLQYAIDKASAKATILLPEIIPGINFINPNKQPHYRFVFVLGAVSDIVFNDTWNSYTPALPFTVFPIPQQTACIPGRKNTGTGDHSAIQ
ncbi:MAG: hypothetical protein U0U70_11155 [Chitinophagaceae bacterium]